MGWVENEKPVGSQLSGTKNPSKTPKFNYLGQQCPPIISFSVE
jgi:hypothetical protein